ncbi:hypothetical protein B7R22_02515 [Subtercola boreus]|uniref:RNA polymerase subunit sigma-70 n=1 Tax=Subtercola boreus TaxID=120213 RepID=A0A3E0W317_9MICO|nr:hypothetical protein [Subtercola boreus]RFA16380.1 hypothetical protein B7R22_02515 [Subtercola boreus]
MAETLDELEEAVASLRVVTEERERLIRRRDELIRAALKGGATWVQIQGVTGLSPRGLSLAIKRLPEE